MMMRSVLPLGAAVVNWAATGAATVTDVRPKLFAVVLGAALVSSLIAGQAAFVTSRLDRQYAAMARAFIQQQKTPAAPERPELAVVRGRDTGAL